MDFAVACTAKREHIRFIVATAHDSGDEMMVFKGGRVVLAAQSAEI